MTYAQATLTSANAAADFVAVLDGLLTGAGWTTVETLTPTGTSPGGGAYKNRVYKSAGTSNLCHYDWYLMVSWITTGTEAYVEVTAGEFYNTGTHVLTGQLTGSFGPTGGGSTIASSNTDGTIETSGGRNASTFKTSTTRGSITYDQTTVPVTTAAVFSTLIPSSAFGYWMSTTLDHVAIFTTVSGNSNNGVVSTLVLDSAYAASSLFDHAPLVGWDQNDGFLMSSHFKGVARSSTTYVSAHAKASGVYGSKLPALADTYLGAFAWAPHVYLDYLTQGSANPTPNTQIDGGIHVGYVPDILMAWGGSMGDTITVSGVTYVLTGPLTSFAANLQPTLAVLVE